MKKLEIHIGGTHYFQVNGSSDIFSGKIIEKVGNKYVCELTDKKLHAFYHIRPNGEMIAYSQLPIVYENVYKEGIFFLSIPIVPSCVYLFAFKPIESECSFLVGDAFSPYRYVIRKQGGEFIPYKKGIDNQLDSMLPEDGPCRRHGQDQE